MPLITSYVQPQEVAQAIGWNLAYPVLQKVSSAYFFNDGVRSYTNLPWLSSAYSATLGNAGMTFETNSLGRFVRKTSGGFTYLYSGSIAQGSSSYVLLGCHTNATNIDLFGDGSKDWKISSGGFLEAYFSSGSRGTGSTSLITNTPIVVSVDSISASTKGYVNGVQEVSFSGWGSAASVSRIGYTGNSGTSNWGVGVQVFLGFNQVLTSAEHKIISDLLLRDPMELFAPVLRRIWVPSATSNTYTLSPGGSFTFSGSSNVLKTKQYSPSGSITFSGTAPELKTKVQVPSGLVTFSGTASLTLTNGSTTYTMSPGGTITFSGTTNYNKERVSYPTGSITFNGTALELKTRSFIPTGDVTFSGTSTEIKIKVLAPTGLITFQGSAPITGPGGLAGATMTRLPMTGVGK